MAESPPSVELSARETWEAWDREHVWHPFTQMAEHEPLLIAAAEGAELITVAGERLLDGVSSLWCNVHGHRHPRIDAAIREQLNQVAHTTLLGTAAPVTVRLARRLSELAPAGLSRVFFSDNGATAVEVALKMAFQYWRQCPDPQPERSLYIAFGDAYHGDTLGAVSVGGVARFHAMFQPLLFPVRRAPTPNLYRLPPDVTPENACAFYLTELERLLQAEAGRVAAVIIEPLLQCAAGMIAHPPGFLQGVRTLTRQHDVFLIADEVAVGFGRTGTMFACQQEDVAPDFLCLGKGLTGGYLPLAATLTTDRVWQAFLGPYAAGKTFFHGHTYSGNPLGAAAALATLEIFEEEQTLRRLPLRIEQLQQRLAGIARRPHVGDVRQRGLIAGIELVADRAQQTPYPWEERRGVRVCQQARQHGVLLRPLGNVIVLMPPLCVSEVQVDRLCQVVEHAIAAVTE